MRAPAPGLEQENIPADLRLLCVAKCTSRVLIQNEQRNNTYRLETQRKTRQDPSSGIHTLEQNPGTVTALGGIEPIHRPSGSQKAAQRSDDQKTLETFYIGLVRSRTVKFW